MLVALAFASPHQGQILERMKGVEPSPSAWKAESSPRRTSANSGTRRWDSNPRRGEYESLVLPLNYAGVIKRDVTESAYKTPTYFSPYRVFDASNWLRSHGFAPVFKVMSHV